MMQPDWHSADIIAALKNGTSLAPFPQIRAGVLHAGKCP
jgi:lambda repressor-like predicted transcriptional regulator